VVNQWYNKGEIEKRKRESVVEICEGVFVAKTPFQKELEKKRAHKNDSNSISDWNFDVCHAVKAGLERQQWSNKAAGETDTSPSSPTSQLSYDPVKEAAREAKWYQIWVQERWGRFTGICSGNPLFIAALAARSPFRTNSQLFLTVPIMLDHVLSFW